MCAHVVFHFTSETYDVAYASCPHYRSRVALGAAGDSEFASFGTYYSQCFRPRGGRVRQFAANAPQSIVSRLQLTSDEIDLAPVFPACC